ncbi:hypothetical protein SBA3_100011 [Candidatus Sulfopaludibacter sp. SbA3]|nr:hypothetical protein SBA3_100011 [Candidatus Sulfopaludibacter sp. SbA3]
MGRHPPWHARRAGVRSPVRAFAIARGRAMKRALHLILALLRELSDENAYQRHLDAHGRAPSGEEWRRFSEERLRAKYSRAKCC